MCHKSSVSDKWTVSMLVRPPNLWLMNKYLKSFIKSSQKVNDKYLENRYKYGKQVFVKEYITQSWLYSDLIQRRNIFKEEIKNKKEAAFNSFFSLLFEFY